MFSQFFNPSHTSGELSQPLLEEAKQYESSVTFQSTYQNPTVEDETLEMYESKEEEKKAQCVECHIDVLWYESDMHFCDTCLDLLSDGKIEMSLPTLPIPPLVRQETVLNIVEQKEIIAEQKEQKEELVQGIECSICIDGQADMMLPCFHNFHRECYNKCSKEPSGIILCPACRQNPVMLAVRALYPEKDESFLMKEYNEQVKKGRRELEKLNASVNEINQQISVKRTSLQNDNQKRLLKIEEELYILGSEGHVDPHKEGKIAKLKKEKAELIGVEAKQQVTKKFVPIVGISSYNAVERRNLMMFGRM